MKETFFDMMKAFTKESKMNVKLDKENNSALIALNSIELHINYFETIKAVSFQIPFTKLPTGSYESIFAELLRLNYAFQSIDSIIFALDEKTGNITVQIQKALHELDVDKIFENIDTLLTLATQELSDLEKFIINKISSTNSKSQSDSAQDSELSIEQYMMTMIKI